MNSKNQKRLLSENSQADKSPKEKNPKRYFKLNPNEINKDKELFEVFKNKVLNKNFKQKKVSIEKIGNLSKKIFESLVDSFNSFVGNVFEADTEKKKVIFQFLKILFILK